MPDNYLPAAVVAAALPKLQEAVLLGDPTALAAIKEWGFESIARVYDPDPIFRPHHYIMKKRAETEWRRMLETHERRLKEILLKQAEIAWEKELGHRIDDRTHQATEDRHHKEEIWNRGQRVGEYKETRSFDTDEQIRLARAQGGISREASADAAPVMDPMERVRWLQREIARIEADPGLTNAMKHRQTEPLQHSIRDILGDTGRGK